MGWGTANLPRVVPTGCAVRGQLLYLSWDSDKIVARGNLAMSLQCTRLRPRVPLLDCFQGLFLSDTPSLLRFSLLSHMLLSEDSVNMATMASKNISESESELCLGPPTISNDVFPTGGYRGGSKESE